MVGRAATVISIVRAGREVRAAEAKPEGPTADALDKEQLDQLHAATLKAADSCFELKKLCATVLVPAGVLVATFSERKLTPAVFVAGFMVIAAFWVADAFSFYYQRRLRVLMKDIWNRRAARCAEGYDHVQKVTGVSWFRAVFNSSMIYYLILAVMVGAALAAYAFGLLGTGPAGHP
ncbi:MULTISPECIES: hypothetical protein [unclassified Amycolatopsis]|uniref:hypothetical protein n=1 Tax=unclassified Amycolatopsis TaxID=2618356 RepID=UPI000F772296|nr:MULTISPECIES: hypothetical protein [unclassified Amycolatopsis]